MGMASVPRIESESRERRLNVELVMLAWVLSVKELSRLKFGVLDRVGVYPLPARIGNREPEFLDLRGNPAIELGLGLL